MPTFIADRLPIAAKSFGKLKDSFLAELHSEITSHVRQEESGVAPQPVQGMVVHDSEVLEPDPIRQGGLVRNDAVCRQLPMECRSLTLVSRDTHSVSLRNLLNLPRLARRYSDLTVLLKRKEQLRL